VTYNVKTLADSIGPHNIRISTLEVTFPRFILAEFNTHRMLSRNAASSRAIPIERVIEQVECDPFIPEDWGTFKRGMVAGPALSGEMVGSAVLTWKEALRASLSAARDLQELRVHKSLVNRLLEPFMWTTVVVTATNWSNFFHLRTARDAQPEFRIIALRMQDALAQSEPERLEANQWHLPYIDETERAALSQFTAATVSGARCARISYLTHDGEHSTGKDLTLADRLISDGHMSPFEHAAQCLIVPARWGNFQGWKQYRKFIPNEQDPKGYIDDRE
jgi:hypothetical protein